MLIISPNFTPIFNGKTLEKHVSHSKTCNMTKVQY